MIAVIDSGVDLAHVEFAGRLWENDDPINGINDDASPEVDDLHGWNMLTDSNDLDDTSGHGTQVGGVIGAAADNGAGVAGMCWGCRLMFVNAMQASGIANYSDVAKAVTYASSNDADVINLSLGGYADSAVLRDAIREAATTAVIVAGAGNDDSPNSFYPAAYPEVLAVAATDQNDQKAIFSNYGPWVDVAAPGTDIRTTTRSEYGTGSGTSLATALVSGLAGLVKSQHPTWTPEQIKWQILNTAANIDAANPGRVGQLGSGRVDAGAALAVSPTPRPQLRATASTARRTAGLRRARASSLCSPSRTSGCRRRTCRGRSPAATPMSASPTAQAALAALRRADPAATLPIPLALPSAALRPTTGSSHSRSTSAAPAATAWRCRLTIQVRSAVETLGNTQYTQNTTWTNDKTYILNGAIVGQSRRHAHHPARHDGQGRIRQVHPHRRYADRAGTADQPIVFTTNSITNATWSGLRFTESAVDADYDAGGAYVAGSVLQYVTISYADVGANLSTRSPYIADAIFSNNRISIQIGATTTAVRRIFSDPSLQVGAMLGTMFRA